MVRLSDEAWHDALKPNVDGYFHGTGRAPPKMPENGWGRIINTRLRGVAEPLP
ncbi:hypothetical protein ACIBVL_41215 [Streptomyces sp. NPDC049687]|uniref:hypothetical protein n=1 Tax=Streptomyces sp. NPDC049687 TaxID=3365596 RepID=UPI0037A71042